MSTARLSAPCPSVRARSRATVDVRAVANPPSKASGSARTSSSLAAVSKPDATTVQQQDKAHAPSPQSLVAENLLHNSFYLPYHCVYQHNVIVELPGHAKTRDAFDSSWTGSGYL